LLTFGPAEITLRIVVALADIFESGGAIERLPAFFEISISPVFI